MKQQTSHRQASQPNQHTSHSEHAISTLFIASTFVAVHDAPHFNSSLRPVGPASWIDTPMETKDRPGKTDDRYRDRHRDTGRHVDSAVQRKGF